MAWDNWMVAQSLDLGMAVVDVSDTLHAFHFAGKVSELESRLS
eukprot:SAG11_NODE_1624_length_4555_cov_3.452424_5_plen_43_part_00